MKSDERERFVTAFVDITNEAGREEEMYRLREEARGDRIAAYDKLQSIAQLVPRATSERKVNRKPQTHQTDEFTHV